MKPFYVQPYPIYYALLGSKGNTITSSCRVWVLGCMHVCVDQSVWERFQTIHIQRRVQRERCTTHFFLRCSSIWELETSPNTDLEKNNKTAMYRMKNPMWPSSTTREPYKKTAYYLLFSRRFWVKEPRRHSDNIPHDFCYLHRSSTLFFQANPFTTTTTNYPGIYFLALRCSTWNGRYFRFCALSLPAQLAFWSILDFSCCCRC